MSNQYWEEGFSQRLEAAINSKGFGSIVDFLKGNEGSTYEQLAKSLGNKIAPIQIIVYVRELAEKSSEEEWFFLDSLVREINEYCPSGWKTGETGEFDAANSIGSWIAVIEPLGASYKLHQKRSALWLLQRCRRLCSGL